MNISPCRNLQLETENCSKQEDISVFSETRDIIPGLRVGGGFPLLPVPGALATEDDDCGSRHSGSELLPRLPDIPLLTKSAPEQREAEFLSAPGAQPALPLGLHQHLPHDEALPPDLDQVLRLAGGGAGHILLLRDQKLHREEAGR